MADKKKSVAKAYVQVVPTVDGIKDTLTKELGGEVSSSFGDIFKGALLSGAVLGAAKEIGGAVLDIGRDAVEAAADVKAANAQFEQTFDELESTATAALRAVSNETGIATTRLKGGYTALYAFTKSVGGDSETALNIAQRALTAAADSAAYYDRTVEDATETLQSFLKGNYANDAALGIAATETTRNAKANELYAKSFNELSEAQKVDVLLSMVEAGNEASGALGQAAREADSWTNVLGELSEAWRQLLAQIGSPIMEGLTPMIQGITEALKGMTEQTSFDILDQGIADFRAGIEEADEAFRTTSTSVAATSKLAQQYVDRLRAIEGAGLETADAQREYAQTVELLNALMPELGLTINEVTGRLDQNTWAIEDNIRSLKEQAENQARMAYYKKIIDEHAEAYEAQYTAQMQLIELQEQEKALVEQLAVANSEYSATLGYNAEAQAREKAHIDELKAFISAVQREQGALTITIDEMGVALTESEDTLKRASEGYAALTEDTQKAAAATDELTEAYNTAKDAARDSIDSQIGLFDELAESSKMTAEEIVANWMNQQEAFGRYSDNLKKAVDLGLDQVLVQQLSNGTQQSMLILDELINGTELSIDEINAAFGGMSEARDTLAGTMAEMEAIANGTYDRMITASEDAGYDSGMGVAKGVHDAIPAVESAFSSLAKSGQKFYAIAMDQHSPSRVMRAKGYDSGVGAALGVEDSIPRMEAAMAELGNCGVASYNQKLIVDTAAYPSHIAGTAGLTDSTVNNSTVSYGGININIYAQPDQNVDALAEQIMYRLQTELEQGAAAFG